MPKRILDEDTESQFAEDDEQLEEQEEEEEEEQPERIEFEKPIKKRSNLPPLPPLPPMRPRPQVQQRQQGQPIQRQIPPIKPQVRYQGFVQQAAEGVVDVETQEVIATDIWTALANVIERLERIENAIGSMMK